MRASARYWHEWWCAGHIIVFAARLLQKIALGDLAQQLSSLKPAVPNTETP
jgi:hypothetical protein